MDSTKQNLMSLIVLVALVAGVLFGYTGYVYGKKAGYDSGYKQAQEDVKAQQEALAAKAGEEAAKASNPFKTTNPLEGVSANPFEDAAKKLNPFAE